MNVCCRLGAMAGCWASFSRRRERFVCRVAYSGAEEGGGRWEVRAVVNWARVLVCGSAIGWLVVRWDGG